MTYIEEYYNFLKANPKRMNKKIEIVLKKLVYDIHHECKVESYNEITEEKETSTYIYDEERANRPIYFIENFCRHSKGKEAGKPFILELWQKAFIQGVYGFIEKDTRQRKYNKAVLFIGRKNGKSTLAAALGLYHLTFENEGGAECYSVAVKKDQAKIVWEEAKRMSNKSPVLRKRIKPRVTGLYYDKQESFFKALASQSDTLDGLNAYFVSADELHAWKDKNLLDVMYDSFGSRDEPMLLETSTMGRVRQSVFDSEYEYFEKVIKGYNNEEGGIVDYTVLPFIYELDSKLDIKDEEKWIKANPGLGTVKSYDFIKGKVEKAKNDIQEYNNLFCKDFNIRTTDKEAWLTFDEILNEETINIEDLKGTYAIGGVDLSSTTDLTCATILIVKQGIKYVLQQYFLPVENIEYKIKEDKIPYDVWKQKGLLTLSEGAKVDFSDVTKWFIRIRDELELAILWIGYDPWGSTYWTTEMKELGFNLVEVRQGARTMSNPMKEMKADLIEKRINYNNNPMLKWCLGNTEIKIDENENIRPVKRKQRERIDGAVSLINAYVVYTNNRQDYEALQE